MSTIATAYVQVLPSTKGIKSELTSAFGDAGTDAGQSMGTKLTSGLMSSIKGGAVLAAGAAIGAALVKGISASVKEGGNLEQSIGGIQTLFKNSANLVMKNASNAWKTAGISANEYMEQTTSFGASLIKSLDGDTVKAAKLADTAIVDMSDNANKMGTDIGMIQNAYQGFAKGNFTMLDNLKLGYGGTKTEMEKLLAEASKLSGVHYDIGSFADIVSAIHEVQNELGITGTTAQEAASTLTGSFNAVKAAAQDVLGGLALGGDISDKLDNLGNAFQTFFNDNLLPMIDNVVSGLPDVFSKLMEGLSGDGTTDAVAKMASIAIKLAKGFMQGLGEFQAAAPLILMKIVEGLIEAAPELAKAVPEMIKSFADAFQKYAPEIAKEMPKLVIAMAEALVMSVGYLIEGLGQMMYELIAQIPQYAADVADAFQSWGPTISEAFSTWGSNIQSVLAPIGQMISETFGPALSGIAAKFAPLVASVQNMFSQIGAFASACASLVGAVFQPVAAKLGAIFQAGVSAIKNAFAPIGAFMSEVGERIVAGLRSAIAKFGSIGKQMMENLKNGIASAAQGIIDYIKGIVDKIASLFEGATEKVNKMTKQIKESSGNAQSSAQGVAAQAASVSAMSAMSAASVSGYSSYSAMGMTRQAAPQQINVILSGSAKNVFDSVRVENNKMVTATGYKALA